MDFGESDGGSIGRKHRLCTTKNLILRGVWIVAGTRSPPAQWRRDCRIGNKQKREAYRPGRPLDHCPQRPFGGVRQEGAKSLLGHNVSKCRRRVCRRTAETGVGWMPTTEHCRPSRLLCESQPMRLGHRGQSPESGQPRSHIRLRLAP